MNRSASAAGRSEGAAVANAPPLVAERVSKTYDDDWHEAVPVIADLSFTLEAGTIVSIVGPSGCGKTTLLNTLSGLIPPSGGDIRWHGRPLRGMPPRVGYMLQKDLLFPWRTAIANVTLGLEIAGTVPRREARERAQALFDQLGLHGFATHYPATLSGGMRQRVALARTLVVDPEVLLLDEPFAALDFQTKLLIEGDTARLVRDQHRAALLITHDVEEAVSLSDRVIVLTRRPCRIKSVYDIELEGDRADMMAARDSRQFTDYVRAIWRDLEVGRA
jgi:NitT/TauT family transport system ATP-binding protein